jgi:hypothetical protein
MASQISYSTNPKSYQWLISLGVKPYQIAEAINSGLNPAQLPPEYFGLGGGYTPQSVVPGASQVIGGIDIPPASMADPYAQPFQGTTATGSAVPSQVPTVSPIDYSGFPVVDFSPQASSSGFVPSPQGDYFPGYDAYPQSYGSLGSAMGGGDFSPSLGSSGFIPSTQGDYFPGYDSFPQSFGTAGTSLGSVSTPPQIYSDPSSFSVEPTPIPSLGYIEASGYPGMYPSVSDPFGGVTANGSAPSYDSFSGTTASGSAPYNPFAGVTASGDAPPVNPFAGVTASGSSGTDAVTYSGPSTGVSWPSPDPLPSGMAPGQETGVFAPAGAFSTPGVGPQFSTLSADPSKYGGQLNPQTAGFDPFGGGTGGYMAVGGGVPTWGAGKGSAVSEGDKQTKKGLLDNGSNIVGPQQYPLTWAYNKGWNTGYGGFPSQPFWSVTSYTTDPSLAVLSPPTSTPKSKAA